MLPSYKRTLINVVGLLLIGCAAPKPVAPVISAPAPVVQEPPAKEIEPPVVVTAPVEPTASEMELAIALTSFERGAYAVALRQLSPLSNDLSLNVPDRLRAIKALAFSQCLTRAVVACRITFERAFKLDPAFSLEPAEQGHPVWGPQFELARKNLKIK